MHKIIAIATAALFALAAHGQEETTQTITQTQTQTQTVTQTIARTRTEAKPHLSLSATVGTPGLGFELGLQLNKTIGLRAGASFMPHFKYPMTFTAQIGEGDQMTADGLETRFERMARLLEGFVGQPVDDKVEMLASPRFNQAKLLVDVSPFRNKRWHLTTGFYCGPKKVAVCENVPKETVSLFAINLYNRLYDNNGEIAMGFSLPPDLMMLVLSFGRAGFPVGVYANDVVYTEDVWVHDDYMNIDYIEHAKGEVIHAKGETYLMAPSDENTAYANAFVSRFRPYFGFGYSGQLKRWDKWSIGFDAGAMFIGGAPKIVDHSGVDLMYDVKNIEGQIGDYVRLARHIKAYPVLEVKLTRRLF